ncbi:MAG: flippase [Patescibacteria group bacterium]
MSASKNIAQNAAWLMIATTAQKAISFVSFTVIARIVEVAVTGEYFFAISITSIFVTFADLGLTPVLIREMAADEKRGKSLLARVILAKAILLPLTAGAAITYAWLIGVRGDVFLAVIIAALFVMAADATSVLWYGAIRGRRELRFEAAGMFVGQIFTAIVGISAAAFGYGVIGLVCGLAVASLWNVGWSITNAFRLGLRPKGGNQWTWKEIATMAFPFALAGIFVKIYSYVDSQILKVVHGSEALGEYAVAYKLTYALQFMPMAFVAALYPGLSHAARHDKGAIPGIMKGSQRLMLLASVPMTALLSALSGRLIYLLYGERYAGSIPALTILPWVLIPIFLDFPIGSLLNSTRRAHLKTSAMGVAMVVNVIMNFLLVPSYGPVGAAWAGVVSFWVLFLVGWWYVRRDMVLSWFGPLFLRGMAAAGVLWGAVVFFSEPMTDVFAFIFGIAAGLTVLFLSGLLTTKDVLVAWRWMRSRISPVPQEDIDLHDKP